MTTTTTLRWHRDSVAACSATHVPSTLTLCAAGVLVSLLGACTVVEQPVVVRESPLPVAATVPAVAPPPVVSVYEDMVIGQPDPLFVPWAPPPLLVQVPPAEPFVGAVWVGGYWVWHQRWVWSSGYWARPPTLGYVWFDPYYEHRGDGVVFVNGFWAAPGVRFVPPAPSLRLTLSVTAAGAFGAAAIGPQGVFVPAPPGSRSGLIVPAPIGTAPAVVVSAPALINPGMRVVQNTHVTINERTTINNTTNITNVRNVTVMAPATATANHAAFSSEVPSQAALAAARPAHVAWQAPVPQSRERVQLAGAANHTPLALPPAQRVNIGPPTTAVHTAPRELAPAAERAAPPRVPENHALQERERAVRPADAASARMEPLRAGEARPAVTESRPVTERAQESRPTPAVSAPALEPRQMPAAERARERAAESAERAKAAAQQREVKAEQREAARAKAEERAAKRAKPEHREPPKEEKGEKRPKE
ncbi:MAG: hypothetical protein IT523_06060 [Burkholderiales bacterium]|nr:hypothetical protein [Burkholderiales bacterium]